jgi:hypothetical protein
MNPQRFVINMSGTGRPEWPPTGLVSEPQFLTKTEGHLAVTAILGVETGRHRPLFGGVGCAFPGMEPRYSAPA